MGAPLKFYLHLDLLKSTHIPELLMPVSLLFDVFYDVCIVMTSFWGIKQANFS